MTKLNNRLFSFFSILGILFFISVIYIISISELSPLFSTVNRHTINFNGLKIVRNKFLDTSYMYTNTIDKSTYTANASNDFCYVALINLKDNVPYVRSRNFNLSTLFTPNTIEINNSTTIPNSALKDKYQILISCNDSIMETFQIDDLVVLLDLKHKKNRSTEKKEIKLISTDNKIIAFANFTID
jgi:hypothetical protein